MNLCMAQSLAELAALQRSASLEATLSFAGVGAIQAIQRRRMWTTRRADKEELRET